MGRSGELVGGVPSASTVTRIDALSVGSAALSRGALDGLPPGCWRRRAAGRRAVDGDVDPMADDTFVARSCSTASVDSLSLVFPVTAPCRVVAQMTNYASHVTDSGMNPDTIPLTFFQSSSSISGPTDHIIRPAHVRLLDYEVEIGPVIGRELPVGTTVTKDNLAEYVVGLVVADDVSARDVQLPQTQFYEAKSYPTFTPSGPPWCC
jgi:2-keto-4-pentenoate hydratase/2-oxohepta-3-ene-1,7-dioic acid hydratase in catechol pathway